MEDLGFTFDETELAHFRGNGGGLHLPPRAGLCGSGIRRGDRNDYRRSLRKPPCNLWVQLEGDADVSIEEDAELGERDECSGRLPSNDRRSDDSEPQS